MSLIPLLMGDYSRPTKLLDQHFGLAITPEDLLLPPYSPFAMSSYYRPWRAHLQSMTQDSGSTVTNDKDTFQVCLDVQQFTPNEITVKTTDRQIVVEGKHEEREDEHGIIFRHFIRKYTLPNQCDAKDVTSSLSSDGVLIISAEKKYLGDENQRIVVINKVSAQSQKSEILKSKGTLQTSCNEDINDSISAKYDKEIKDSISATFDKDMKDSLSTRFEKDIKDSIITSIKGSSKIEDVKLCLLKSDESVKHALNDKSYSMGLSGAEIESKKDVRLMEKKDFSSSMMSSCGALTTEEAFESSEMSCQMKKSDQNSSTEIIIDTLSSELKRAAENV